MRRAGNRCWDRNPSRRGFTLVETVVVTGVFGTLLALGLAGVQRVRQSATSTQCANNLRQIGLAYLNFVDKNQGNPRSFKGDSSWISNLRPYLGSRDESYFCPLLDRTKSAQEVPIAWIRVHQNTFSEYGGTHDIPLSKDGPRMRLSNRYTNNATAYHLEMEDWTNWNWRDLDMRVAPLDDGGHKVTALFSSAGYTYDFLGPDRKVLVNNYKPAGQGNSIAIVPSGKAYGVSAQAAFLGADDGEKVLIAEYSRPVVSVFGNNSLDYWPALAAPRHGGFLNVLFKNGTVQRFASAEIDPRDSEIYQRHWLPTVPGPF